MTQDRIFPGIVLMLAFCALAPLLDVASKLAAENGIPVGQITAARCAGPLLNLGEGAYRPSVGKLSRLSGLVQTVRTQITATPFEQGGTHRHIQCLPQARNVTQEKLVLQTFGGGADQRAFA